MEHKDFVIGDKFFTATGMWLCTDKGTKIITAVKCDKNGEPPKNWEVNEEDVIFFSSDFGGCDLVNRF